jgi:hypothetical protein
VSYPPVGENTLGLLAEVRASRSLVGGARRLVRPENPHRASLGTAFIGIGASLVCGIRAIYGFSWFVANWPDYPNPVPALAAWILLIVVLSTAFVTASIVGDRLPDWMFALFLALLGTVIALDIVAVWDLHDVGRYATASLTAAMALLLVITLRRPAEILIAIGVIGATLITVMLVNTRLTPDNASAQITSLAFAVLPVVIGVMIVRGFRSMVQVELDRVLVQSTVSAPRFAVGMLASEELARLDLAAEELLDSVATGRIALPLRPKTASVAASLANDAAPAPHRRTTRDLAVPRDHRVGAARPIGHPRRPGQPGRPARRQPARRPAGRRLAARQRPRQEDDRAHRASERRADRRYVAGGAQP